MTWEHAQCNTLGAQEMVKAFEKHMNTQSTNVDPFTQQSDHDEKLKVKERNILNANEQPFKNEVIEDTCVLKSKILEEVKLAIKTDTMHVIREGLEDKSYADIGVDDLTVLIHEVARYNAIEAAKFLLESGFDNESNNNDRETPLHIASQNNSIDVAKILVEKGATIDLQDKWGDTPLHDAVGLKRCISIIKILLEHGASKSITNNKGKTPFDIVCNRADRPSKESIQDLKELLKF